ncbi:conserved hypothetical protein [Halorhabdus utahensis DSM 12940]|uniref:Uncharacterized protein n=1 Tax=Halorhabdus utahensis (strain DSM 12940 / JCM 11049 / AX-2) TaxID=519442 RepID=C7NTL1_HALUD|nr:hypothetical protein [Halorhabdus utahensis]ACV12201.1 conserved hypothetical protein [Halorhabdus utahensis DSM 12940]
MNAMVDGSLIALFYTSARDAEIFERALNVCKTIGFDLDDTSEPFPPPSGEHARAVQVPVDGWSVTFRFDLNPDRAVKEPSLTIGGFTDSIDPGSVESLETYCTRMDILFELLCRLAIRLETEYMVMADTEGRPNAVTPTGRPISDHVQRPPSFGVYSPEVLAEFGDVDNLFDAEPWYVAELEDGRTVVIESASPWNESGWEPPTDTDYIERAEIRTTIDQTDPSAQPEGQPRDGSTGKFDPFTALEPGEYGADVGVHPDDITSIFRNEDLQLVRVYVDDHGDLRRADGGAFVRNVVSKAANDKELVQKMLANIPLESNEEARLISALLHEAIPPAFVRLDGPDDENIVTRVMDLDVETNKYQLLVSLGQAVEEASGEPIAKIESALDTLAEMEDAEDIDSWIEANLL